jgi:hypothetical protein
MEHELELGGGMMAQVAPILAMSAKTAALNSLPCKMQQ